MNKEKEALYKLIGNQRKEEVKVEKSEKERVYAKTMTKLKLEDKKQMRRPNKRKYRVLLVAATLMLMNISGWAMHEHIFKDFIYIFTSQQGDQERANSNEQVEAFSDEDEKLMEKMGKVVNQKVSNGLDVTLCKVVGDINNLYVIFEVEDPTGTIDFTKLENRPMIFYESDILFPETGGECGGSCEEILEKRTPHKTQFMMACLAKDKLNDKKISIILKDLVAVFEQDIQPLAAEEKDLSKLYELLGSNENWMDRKSQGRIENVIHVMEASKLEQMTIEGDEISFYFDVPYRTTDIYLMDSIALRNKETREIKAPSKSSKVKYSDPNSKYRGKNFVFQGITKEELDKWELVTGYDVHAKMIAPGGWHFGLEIDFVDHTKILAVDEILELECGEDLGRYHITEVNLSGVSITVLGTNLESGEGSVCGFEGKLVMKNGDEVKFRLTNTGGVTKDIHLSGVLPCLVDVEEVEEIVFDSGMHIKVDEA